MLKCKTWRRKFMQPVCKLCDRLKLVICSNINIKHFGMVTNRGQCQGSSLVPTGAVSMIHGSTVAALG